MHITTLTNRALRLVDSKVWLPDVHLPTVRPSSLTLLLPAQGLSPLLPSSLLLLLLEWGSTRRRNSSLSPPTPLETVGWQVPIKCPKAVSFYEGCWRWEPFPTLGTSLWTSYTVHSGLLFSGRNQVTPTGEPKGISVPSRLWTHLPHASWV